MLETNVHIEPDKESHFILLYHIYNFMKTSMYQLYYIQIERMIVSSHPLHVLTEKYHNQAAM